MAACRLSPMNIPAFIVIFLLLLKIRHMEGFLNENGVVTPKDPFKFLGEPLILYCNITNDNLVGDASDLYFETKTGQEVKLVPPQYTERLTTKSIRLRLPSVNLGSDGIYSCNMKTFNPDKPEYIGHQIVKVDYRPRAVNDITCRVYNWEEMLCNWTLGVDYQHMEDINVTLIWTVDGKQRYCPRLSEDKTSCTWPAEYYFHNHKYYMRVIVKNLRRKDFSAKSPQFNVETRLYVEPAPINNFQATEESSRCITLTWQHPSLPIREKVFIAEYRAQGSTQWEDIRLDDSERKEMKTNICDLTPNTKYTFRMQVMPYPEYTNTPKQQNGFSSAWKTVVAETFEDIPDSAPKICASCFSELVCHKDDQKQCPSVRIYWQKIPVPDRNGVITGYQLSLYNRTKLLTLEKVGQQMTYYDIHLPDIQEEYKITLRAGTGKGYSDKKSEILIPAESQRLKVEAPYGLLVEKGLNKDGTSTYYLHWEKDKSRQWEHKSIVIVWCDGHMPDFSCKENINWVVLPAERVTYMITPRKDDAQSNLIFGIAKEVHNEGKVLSSGIHWASCIYLTNGNLPKPPRILQVTDKPETRGLSVLWKKPDCPKDRVYITGFGVSLCPAKDKTSCIDQESTDKVPLTDEIVTPSDPYSKIIVHLNNTRNQVEFQNLRPHRKYLVQVWAMSVAGVGDKSIPVLHEITDIPENEDMNKGAIIIIIVCGVVLFLIVLCSIYCARRYCITRRKKLPAWNEGEIMHYAQSISHQQYLVPRKQHVQDRPLPELPREESPLYHDYEQPWV